ncbi:MAG: hypothetical protein WA268_19620 [Xanthobacteraceae bacterium]
MSSDAHSLLMTFGGRAFVIAIALVIVAAVALFGRVYGQHLAHMAMEERDSAIRKLEIQSQQLELGRTDREAKVKALQGRIASLQAELSVIVPSKNMYSINPNQSLLVADGHLTIGLVGSPLTNGINININGKQQHAAVGDVIRVSPDTSTACVVQIESFDMFKAQFTASCGPAKT